MKSHKLGWILKKSGIEKAALEKRAGWVAVKNDQGGRFFIRGKVAGLDPLIIET